MCETGEFDDSVAFDQDELQWMNPVWERLVLHRMPTAPLWSFGYGELREACKKAIDAANARCLAPTLYSLRHGGACHDVIMGRRTLVEVAKPGRWRSSQNVRRYEKHGRLSLQINGLPASLLAQLMRGQERLPELLVAGSDALVNAQSSPAQEYSWSSTRCTRWRSASKREAPASSRSVATSWTTPRPLRTSWDE